MTAIRAATSADIEQIVAFNAAMALETEDLVLDRSRLRAGVSRVFQGDAAAFYRLAEQDGRVVGQLMVTVEWSDWRDAWVWWIQSVYVLPEARRGGVYRALHAAVVEEARAAGAAGVRLYVDARNTRAMATYAAMGMDGDHYRVFEQMFPLSPR